MRSCSPKWSTYLGAEQQNKVASTVLRERLSESLGVSETEITDARSRITHGEWSYEQVAAMLDEHLQAEGHSSLPTLRSLVSMFQHQMPTPIAAPSGTPARLSKPLQEYLQHAFEQRPCDGGPAGAAAMPIRLRRFVHTDAAPMLSSACKLCEASFPNQTLLKEHCNVAHGGEQRARRGWLHMDRVGMEQKHPNAY